MKIVQRLTLGELTANTRPICYGVLKPGREPMAGVPMIRVSDISGNYFDDSNIVRISHELDEEFRRSRLRGGEILISIQGTVGRVAICPPEYGGANISRTIAVIEADSRVHREYLYWYLRYLNGTDGFASVGSTRASLNIETLRRVEIPLPSLEDQRRISTILDHADELRKKRGNAAATLDELEEAILKDALESPNLHAWPSLRIGDICKVKGGKRLPKGDEYSSIATPYRYIRVSDIVNGEIDQSALRYLNDTTHRQIARYIVAEGDIIISIAGTIGAIAEVPESLAGANLTENAAKLSPICTEKYLPEFLAQLLRQPAAQKQMEAKTGQVTIGKLALFRIEQIEVPIPPVSTQKAVVDRIWEIRNQRSLNAMNLAHLNSLFASLEHRAFRGEI